MSKKMMKSIPRYAVLQGAVVLATALLAAVLLAVSCTLVLSQPMGRIVYRSSGNYILMVRETGGEPFQLTNDGGYSYSPVWSPDGTKIAFISDRSSAYEIFVMNGDGTGQRRLALCEQPENTFLCWAPDSKTLYYLTGLGSAYDIYSIDIITMQVRTIHEGFTLGSATVKMSLSPDGSRIAFVGYASGSMIYVKDLDGSDAPYQLLTGICTDPYWTSDSKRILCRLDTPSGIALVNAGSTTDIATLEVIPGTESASVFAVAPDGKRIAFSRGNELILVNNESGNLRTLHADVVDIVQISWSPDGFRLLITAYNGAMENYIRVVSTWNGNVVFDTADGYSGAPAFWAPR